MAGENPAATVVPTPQPVTVVPPGVPATAAATPAAPAPVTPPVVPDPNTVTLSKADLERFQRYEQQVKGFTPLADAAAKLGLKSAADLERVAPFLKAVTAAQQPEPQQQQAAGPLTADQIAAAVDQRIEYRTLREQHNAAIRAESDLITSAVDKLVGAGASQAEKDLTRRIVAATFEERRQPYQVGHPLGGESLAPITAQLAEAVVKEIGDLRTAARAASLASQQPKPGMIATPGTSVGLGQPPQTTPTGQPMSKAQIMAEARAKAQQWVAAQQQPSGI